MAAALAGCGDGSDGADEDPFKAVERREQRDDAKAKATAGPRWERVTTLRGSGTRTRRVRIARGAVQWRVRWRCRGRGELRVSLSPAPREGSLLGRGGCPGDGSATAIDTGSFRLRIRAPGRWTAVIEQQVTTPLREPPLPAMGAPGARVVARGRFYPIERRGRGTATLYRLENGRVALRLADFNTSANTDLFVWLSRAPRPRTTKQALRSPHVVLAPLKSTIGEQNYLLPRGTDATQVRSVVIWCDPIQIAYTAATLR